MLRLRKEVDSAEEDADLEAARGGGGQRDEEEEEPPVLGEQ